MVGLNLEIVLTFIFFFNLVLGKHSCDLTSVVKHQCSINETCEPISPHAKNSKEGYCECRRDYYRLNETHCEKAATHPTPRSDSLVEEADGSSSIVAGILVPLFLVSIVICGVYFSRKYQLVSYIRSKLNQRSSNYDEVMIGQDLDDDDPPLR